MALKQRMEATGVPYANADELIEAVRHVQLAEESEMYDIIHHVKQKKSSQGVYRSEKSQRSK